MSNSKSVGLRREKEAIDEGVCGDHLSLSPDERVLERREGKRVLLHFFRLFGTQFGVESLNRPQHQGAIGSCCQKMACRAREELAVVCVVGGERERVRKRGGKTRQKRAQKKREREMDRDKRERERERERRR